MLAWSPILVQKTEIHALGFVLRKLQLNRHSAAEVEGHAHPFSQLILYLSGEGEQTLGGKRHAARTGDLFVIPRGTTHGFLPRGRSRPLCLVLDFESASGGRRRHRSLSQASLNALHAHLAKLPAKGRLQLSDYSTVLAVVAALLEPPRDEPPAPSPTLAEQVEALLRDGRGLGSVARALGYHRDHLNRRLRAATGLGLRDHRERLRLERAQLAVGSEPTIAQAAARAGFDDANYFARWFRRRTGKTPSGWKRA